MSEIIVIGSGLAALSAAIESNKFGNHVTILEKDKRYKSKNIDN